MKNTGQCVKCESKDVIRVVQSWAHTSEYANVIITDSTITNAVKVIRYVCGECGYSEEWIDDKRGIEKIREKYG